LHVKLGAELHAKKLHVNGEFSLTRHFNTRHVELGTKNIVTKLPPEPAKIEYILQ